MTGGSTTSCSRFRPCSKRSVAKLWLIFSALNVSNSLWAWGSPRPQNQAPQQYPLYNLSILLPKPQRELKEAWSLAAESCGGAPLLAQNLFADIPALLRVPYSIQEQYEEMRLVGVRFDPQQSETRLVFQPLIWAEWGRDEEKGYWGEDAAIHLFFRTSPEQIVAWQNQMKKDFGRLNPQLLGVHPFFKRGGNMWKLNFVMCDLVRTGAFKVTYMNVRGARVLWNFGGFALKREGDGLVRGDDVAIPNAEGIFLDDENTGRSVQRVARFAGSPRAGLLPKPVRGDHLMELFLTDTAGNLENPVRVRTVVDRIENPTLNSPQTVDCVSCHAAESSRRWLELKYNSGATDQAYRFDGQYGLDASVSDFASRNTANFRIFGYLDNEAVIARRALNETVQIQQFLWKK